jgi:cytidylate kinase
VRVVAIDGPAGSGKSTVARGVAAALGLGELDTGAMYRTVTLAALQRGVPLDDGVALAAVARAMELQMGERVLLDGEDVSEDIRGLDVSSAVSTVAAHPEVREELVRRQREWAESHDGGVVEGRDIGTVVFPDAHLKVFLTASEEERARRRRSEGSDEGSADLARRDRLDSTRAASPLKPADDAVVIDSTGRSAEDVIADVVARVRAAEA